MKSLEIKVISFFNKWGFDLRNQDSNIVINTVSLNREDAIMIFEDFIKEFQIEFGYHDFSIEKYFYKISFADSLFLSFFKESIEKKYPKKPPITVKHMIEVAKKREWFDPE